MRIAEVLLQDFEAEISNTRRTLERVPDDKPDYKAHERSMPLGKLAMHCATLPIFGVYIIEDEGMDLAAPKREHLSLAFESRAVCLQRLEETSQECRAALQGASDEHLEAIWRFSYGEQIISQGPRVRAFRYMFFNHMIHHVAQLGVYLRLNDLPVPALYGPSADEQWSAR